MAGDDRPIGVFELVGVGRARSRLDLSRERGLSHFVGRADEMAVLEEAFEQQNDGPLVIHDEDFGLMQNLNRQGTGHHHVRCAFDCRNPCCHS
jgi:hypothetical protein